MGSYSRNHSASNKSNFVDENINWGFHFCLMNIDTNEYKGF